MKLFFSLMLISIIVVSAWASLDQNVFEGFHYLVQNRWGIATFFDTYFGFLTIYLWIAYKEKNFTSKLLWFVLVCAFGSIAFSIYILKELVRLKGGGIEKLLLRQES